MKLHIALATRGRPEQLLRTLRASIVHWTHPNTTLSLEVDSDDYGTLGALTNVELDPRVSVNMQKRPDTIAAKWNRSLSNDADVFLMMADDDPHITPGYDAKIIEAAETFPDKLGLVYGHMANASFSSINAVTKPWAEKLGYIVPEHFPYWFCDHWLDDIAHMTQRIAFADVKSDQSSVGVTQEMREPAWWATWFDAAKMVRRNEALGIIEALDEPDWRKKILRNRYHHVEYRSKWINDNVRAQARQLSMMQNLSLKDDRYMRVKQKAVEAIPAMLKLLPQDEAQAYLQMLVPPNVIQALPQMFAPQAMAS